MPWVLVRITYMSYFTEDVHGGAWHLNRILLHKYRFSFPLPHLLFCFISKCPNWLARKEVALRAHSVTGLYGTASHRGPLITCQQAFGGRNTGPHGKATAELDVGHLSNREGWSSGSTICSLEVPRGSSLRANAGMQVEMQSQELTVVYEKFPSFYYRKPTFLSRPWALSDGAVFCLPGSYSR